MCFYFFSTLMELTSNSRLDWFMPPYTDFLTQTLALLYSPVLVRPLLKATCYFEKTMHSLSCFNWHRKQRKSIKKEEKGGKKNTLHLPSASFNHPLQ